MLRCYKSINKKICSLCKEEKAYSMFNKDKGKKDGLFAHCKECRKNSRIAPKITEELTTLQHIESAVHELSECPDYVTCAPILSKIQGYMNLFAQEKKATNDNSFMMHISDIGLQEYNHNSIILNIQLKLMGMNKNSDLNKIIILDRKNGNLLVIIEDAILTEAEKNMMLSRS